MKSLVRYCLLITALCLLVSCKSTQPVSSNTEVNHTKDSTSNTTTQKTDSSTHKETAEKKTLPGATVGMNLTRSQWDSLVTAMQNMPRGAETTNSNAQPKTIYITDPQLKAQLSIALDSLGRISLKCQALDQVYYEKHVEQTRYIAQLMAENTKVKEENSRLQETVEAEKKGFGHWVKEWATTATIWFVIIGGFIVLILEGFKRLRKDGNT